MQPSSDLDSYAPLGDTLRLIVVATAFAACLLGFPNFASAASPTQPQLELAVHKVVSARGREPEKLVSADAARAGDTLEYSATYRNPTAQTVRNAQVTLPVPGNGVEYLIETASPALQAASRDGQTFVAVPLMHQVTGADGKPVTRAAPAADYRFLRWSLGDLAPGSSRTVRARVQLLPLGSAR